MTFIKFTHPDWDDFLVLHPRDGLLVARQYLGPESDQSLLKSKLMMGLPKGYLESLPEFQG